MQRPLIALLALLALTQAPPAQAVTLDRLLAEADTVWTADVPPGSPGRVVKRLLADEPLPIDCLTPLHLAALQQGLDPLTSETAGRLAEPPALAEPWNWVDPENRFRIHFSTRPDSPHAVPAGEAAGPSDPPAYVAEVHAALSAALDILVDDLGFRPPLTDSWIEVYLADPGPGVSGYVVPANGVSSRSDEARGGFLVLGNRLADPAAAAVHQLAHLVLLGYSHHEPVWWHEASAAWMGVLATGDATAEAASIAAHMALPEGGLADEDLARMRGALLFPAFLGLGEAVPHTLRAVWAECAAVGGDNLLPALEAVAGASGRGSLTDLLRAYYASWVADSAGRSHLTAVLGLPLESPGLSVDVTSYPSAGGSPGGPVAPLGAAFVHLRSLDEPGGVSLTLEGEPEGRWDALLLVRSSPRDRFLAVPMPVDEAGSSRVNYPRERRADGRTGHLHLLGRARVRHPVRPDPPRRPAHGGGRSGPVVDRLGDGRVRLERLPQPAPWPWLPAAERRADPGRGRGSLARVVLVPGRFRPRPQGLLSRRGDHGGRLHRVHPRGRGAPPPDLVPLATTPPPERDRQAPPEQGLTWTLEFRPWTPKRPEPFVRTGV